MKKIKTINKLLSSLTLLSPLSGIGFNNQYENTQKVITENSYFNSVGDQRPMGDITVNVEGTIITGYVSGTGNLVVDSDITEIAANAFKSNSNINGLDLSNATSLTTIGNHAFVQCSNLTGDLFIPSSVTSIGQLICSRTNITSITIDPSNTTYSLAKNLGSSACVVLSGTDGIWKDDSKSIGGLALGDIVIPSNVTSIRDDAFYNTNITSLDLSQATSLTTIEGDGTYGEQGAFSYCQNLTGDLVIPSNVTSIGYYAFYKTKITSLDLSNATNLNSIGDSAFSDCLNLTGDLVIPSSVTNIGNNAFDDTNITSLDLTNATSLTTIDNSAFYYCSNLTGDIIIPSNVTSIGRSAFANSTIDNLYFLSETPRTSFGASWQPTLNGNQIEISSKNSNTGLILGLIFGLGIPILATIGFGIWCLNKKKKNNTNI